MMGSNTQHTPGPWIINYDGGIWTEPNETDKYSRRICSLPWGSFKEFNEAPNKANARLIAAAPDLLEAVEAMAEYISGQWADDHGNRPNCLRMGEDSIAKARNM